MVFCASCIRISLDTKMNAANIKDCLRERREGKMEEKKSEKEGGEGRERKMEGE